MMACAIILHHMMSYDGGCFFSAEFFSCDICGSNPGAFLCTELYLKDLALWRGNEKGNEEHEGEREKKPCKRAKP